MTYAVLLSMPFVPGDEIGPGLLMMPGAWIAPLVWVTTVAGLTTAYLGGCSLRTVPRQAWPKLLRQMRIRMELSRKLGPIRARLISRPGLALVVTFNIPGNAVIGGGGGLSLLAGLSEQLTLARFLVASALATAPMPLTIRFGWIAIT